MQADDAALAAFIDLPIPVAVLDRELRFAAVNDALAAINGLSVADHIGRYARDVLPDLDDTTWAVLRRVVETGEPATHLVVGRTPALDAEGAWLEQFHPWRDPATGEVRGVITTVIDVTDQRRAQRSATARQERLAGLALLASDMIGVHSQEQIAAILCDQAERILGAAAAAIAIGARDEAVRVIAAHGYGADVAREPQRLAVGTALADTASTGTRHAFVEGPAWDRRFPDGAAFHRELGLRAIVTTPLVSADETIGALALSYREPHAFDDDDAATLATLASIGGQAMERARAADERQRHAAIREAFTDVMAHELKTPLATIYGALQTITSHRASLSPEVRDELLADATEEAHRLVRLVDDLIVLSRLERGEGLTTTEPLMLSHVARAVVASKVVSLGVAIALNIDPGLPPVRGETQYVEQVLRNLLGNAFKYGRPPYELAISRDEAEVRVSVLDSGPGVPADSEALFTLYYRHAATAKTASGSGIGLFVCRELVRLMGGRTWAANRPTGGAEFGFALPVWVDDNG
jgi:PAS domain S-box-containing protein